MDAPLLTVEDLAVSGGSDVRLVEQVSLDISAGEILGLVGESGCGKSLTAFSILNLLPPPLEIASGSIRFNGRPLDSREAAAVRGRELTVIFQEPGTALNPVVTIGEHLREVLARNRDRSLPFGPDPVGWLKRLQVPSPETVVHRYPFQLSGGMQQRVMIAIALAPGPKLVVADEPTTALDPTTRVEILHQFLELTRQLATAVLFISHDLSMLEQVADRIAVMYAGRIVESGPTQSVVGSPAHPYTQGLLACVPQRTTVGERLPVIGGAVPPPEARPSGCAFRDRCDRAVPACSEAVPDRRSVGIGHWATCPVAAMSGALDHD